MKNWIKINPKPLQAKGWEEVVVNEDKRIDGEKIQKEYDKLKERTENKGKEKYVHEILTVSK